jgi:hypothetical protein
LDLTFKNIGFNHQNCEFNLNNQNQIIDVIIGMVDFTNRCDILNGRVAGNVCISRQAFLIAEKCSLKKICIFHHARGCT